MQWTPLPQGAFTGIDWSRPGATAGFDPYLIWAEAEGFGHTGGTPKWLPIVLEVNPGTSIAQLIANASPQWLRIPSVYVSSCAPVGLRFCTAKVGPAFFQEIQPGGKLHGLVKRLELGMPVEEPAEAAASALPPGGASSANEPRSEQLLGGKVMAVIDDGLALAHANLLFANGEPRTAFFWRQDAHGVGRRPAGLDYGHELTADAISAAIDKHRYNGLVDEAAVYVELGLSRLGERWGVRAPYHALDTSVSHGTHVADLAVGPRTLLAQVASPDAPPSWNAAHDDASRCPLVAVQLDYRTVKDSSGGSMAVHILDGLMYVLSRCEATAKIAVNISFGTIAGPHDGSSMLESAMQQLIALGAGRLMIAVAAGNSYQQRTHANVSLSQNESALLHCLAQPDDQTPSFIELWLSPGAAGIEIEITPPGRGALPTLGMGQSGVWRDEGGKLLCALIYPTSVSTGERGTCALLALAPTFSFAASEAVAPSGNWGIRLSNRLGELATVDAYIERDEVIAGDSGARQAHFVDDAALAYGEQYDLQSYVDDPRRVTPIRRGGNFNSIATASEIVSVGGMRIGDGTWARYSPRRPDPDDARPERPSVVKMPARAAYSDEDSALAGVRAAGTRSASAVRLAGTSAAAPQVARALLNAM